MSAPADHTPSSLDATTHTSIASSKRTSSITRPRSRMRSASYVFAFGLSSQAIATRSFFSIDMYVRSIGAPRRVPSYPDVINVAFSSGLLEDRDVVRGCRRGLPDPPREPPPRLVREAREGVRRDQEEVEPVSHAALVPDPQADEPWRPPAGDVPLHVREVMRDPGAGDTRVPDDPPARSRDLVYLPEELPHLREVPREAKVVPHEEDRVERPESAREARGAGLVHLVETANAREGDL